MGKLMVVVLNVLLLVACSGQMQMGPDLGEVARGFSESMRWSDFSNAASYLDLEPRAEFKEKFSEDNDLHVVDSRILSIVILPDGKRADIVYQLEYYHLPSSQIKKWRWKQRWELASGKMTKPGIWMIQNGPPDLPWQKLKGQKKGNITN